MFLLVIVCVIFLIWRPFAVIKNIYVKLVEANRLIFKNKF